MSKLLFSRNATRLSQGSMARIPAAPMGSQSPTLTDCKHATCKQKEEEASRASGRKERPAKDEAGKDDRPPQQRTSARESDNGDAGARHSKRPRTEAEVGNQGPTCHLCSTNNRL